VRMNALLGYLSAHCCHGVDCVAPSAADESSGCATC